MRKQWHKTVLNLVKWPAAAFGAASTALGGVSSVAYGNVDVGSINGAGFDALVLPNTLNSTAEDRYAAHSSHRSHGSHGSHRSSGGGGVAVPRTAPSTPSPSPSYKKPKSVAPSLQVPKSPATSSMPKPSAADTSGMVVRVQAALMRLGYFGGDIDGVLGPETRASITKYQKAKGLKQTGRMDIATLTQLGISIP